MPIKEVTMYNAVCDNCGYEPDFGDFSCLGDADSVRCSLEDWKFNDDNTCLCDDCLKELQEETTNEQ